MTATTDTTTQLLNRLRMRQVALLLAIDAQRTLHAAAQPGNGLGCIVQDLNGGAHSTGSSAGAATI